MKESRLENFRCYTNQSACKYVLSAFFAGFSDKNTRWVSPSDDDFTVRSNDISQYRDYADLLQKSYLSDDDVLARRYALPLIACVSTEDIHATQKTDARKFIHYAQKESFGYNECLDGNGFSPDWLKRPPVLQEGQNTAYWHERINLLGLVIIIPTYNNGKTLATVIDQVQCYARHIIVVNDGSTDNTADILERAATPTLHVITHPTNRGKGTALKHALCHAKQQGYRYAITIDSDGQHFASDIPLFIEAIEQTPDTLLVGARNLASDNMPGKNTFANKFSNFWFTLETGTKLQDTQSGYRLYPLHPLNVQKWYYTAKYEFELEAIVFAAWAGITVRNIPIHVYYPPQEERVSHFRPFRDFTRISVLNTVLVLITLLWILPRNFIRQFTWSNCKRFFYQHIVHSKESNLRITAAIMLGIFMGIVPIWGYQMLATLFLAHILKLNKVIAIVAANISLPPIIPFLLYGSYLTGCKVMGQPANLRISELSFENVKSVLEQYLIGSVIFAAVCSIVMGIITISMLTVCRRKTT